MTCVDHFYRTDHCDYCSTIACTPIHIRSMHDTTVIRRLVTEPLYGATGDEQRDQASASSAQATIIDPSGLQAAG